MIEKERLVKIIFSLSNSRFKGIINVGGTGKVIMKFSVNIKKLKKQPGKKSQKIQKFLLAKTLLLT